MEKRERQAYFSESEVRTLRGRWLCTKDKQMFLEEDILSSCQDQNPEKLPAQTVASASVPELVATPMLFDPAHFHFEKGVC